MSIATRLDEILTDSLFTASELTDGSPPSNAVLVEGIVSNFALHPERLESHRAEVLAICKELLTDEFIVGKGGGWTFLNLCMSRTGEMLGHRTSEALYVLAAGLGFARSLMPREMWDALPGGVPYVSFELGGAQ